MFTKPDKQMKFEDQIYELITKDNFLRQLREVINWGFVNKYCQHVYSDKGRPAYPAVMMFRLLLIQFLYDLSDRQLEESVRYRIDFRWFCQISGTDPGPDHTVYCRFRDRLGVGIITSMWNEIVAQASEAGLITDRLSAVDSTHVKAKVNVYRWKDDDENPGAKQGPDPDARFGHKTKNKRFFGYKCSIGEDVDSGMITMLDVSPGNESDIMLFESVADIYADAITADKGYDAPRNYDLLHGRGQEAAIIPKHLKGKESGHVSARYSDDGERARYYRRKKKRPIVEGKFNEMKNIHGFIQTRYYGIDKVRIQAYLTAMVINMKRMVALLTGRPRWVRV
jgi:IS5 family transposase